MPESHSRPHSPPPSSVLTNPNSPMLVDVALPRHFYRVFTYLVPAHLQSLIRIGSRVRVPFGHATLHGMVVELRPPSNSALDAGDRSLPSPPIRLREIDAIVDDAALETPAELMTLSRLVSEYYLAPWGQCIRLILPAQPSVKHPARFHLTEIGREWLEKADNLHRISPTCQTLLARLHRRPKGLTIATLRHGAPTSLAGDLSMLKRRKLIRETAGQIEPSGQRVRLRLPRQSSDSRAAAICTDQPAAWRPQSTSEATCRENILTAINTGRPARFLLHAPAQHRISLVFEAAEAVLRLQRRVILITPEISKAEALASAAKTRWGDRVELFHSGLPAAVRYERWHRLQSGSIEVVVGTRSAIFAPISSIGLIAIDEEESPSMKEETEPRYHARDVAWMRAQRGAAVVLLGSAHPSLETMHMVGVGISEHSHVAETAVGAMTACNQGHALKIRLVNLRETPYGTVLSDSMVAGMRTALETRAGIILFLNRKGFASALVCRECGHTPLCPQCSIALTFYKQRGRLACHYCGTSRSLPDTCLTCQASRLQPSGIGTEAVEEWTRRLFPDAKIARMDSTASSRSAHASVRRKFITGDLDVLIGTQMLCQGEPSLSAGFVGLVQADAGLHMPDFRASEHTYHTLMDAIALARSHTHDAQVVLQTLLPTHYVIQAVATQDPALFYKQELAFRQALAYPPFARLISLCVSGRDFDRTRRAAGHWAEQLTKASPQLTIWGPIPSAVAKLRDKHRWQIIVKSSETEIPRRSVQHTLTGLETDRQWSGIKFEVDVDPITTL